MRGRSARGSIWLALIACVVLQPASGAKPAPDLSGSWVRDTSASDDPVEKAEAQSVQTGAPRRRPWGISFPGGVWYPGAGRGPTRGGTGGGAGGPWGGTPGAGSPGSGPGGGGGPYGGGPPGGGTSGGGGAGGGRGGGSNRSPALGAAEVEQIARGIEAIKIDHREPQLTVRDANGETRVLFTDGRVLGDGIGSKTVAVWRGDTLEVDTRGSLGSKSEKWSLDGEQLRVTTTFDPGRGGGFTFNTVYDRVEGSERADERDAARVAEVDAVPGSRRGGSAPADLPDTDSVSTGPDGAAGDEADLLDAADESRAGISKIRLLPPSPKPGGGLLSGKVGFDTLTIDPEVAVVEFYLDGERVSRRAWPPFETKLTLADPPREQVVRAVALAANDRVLGEDSLVVNRVDPPFKVRVASIARTSGGALEVRADLSMPRRGELERVAFFLGDRALGEMTRPPFVARVESADVDPETFVRVVATLRDGRERENVALLDEKVFVEHVDVRMVELQLVVTDRTGTAVGGLGVEDFEVLEGNQTRRPENLYPAERVGLLLGLAIDSSGSMWPLWDQTRSAARYFLDHTLGERDRAFLVDFDSELRLVESPTADRQSLAWGLERLSPHGGTVLYDSILFSMLQYEGEHGRRALIVLTDGVDSESRSDPRRAIEFGRRLGVPVYVIALSGTSGTAAGPGWQHSSARTTASMEEAAARNELRLITDPTGGRLFHVVTPEQMSRAFAEIQEELHRQYVLTYYTERQPGEGGAPEVRVKRAGLEVRSAVPLETAD
jgi:Ca-activated chloride channel family protein